jgi:hypothetical protein
MGSEKKKEAALIGRPSTYSNELSDEILSRIACGESMRSITRCENMPCMATVFKWLREKDEFSQQYIKAKLESADAWADDIVDIADNQAKEILIIQGAVVLDHDEKPVYVATNTSINHARLRIDARRWAASKLKPKKYGEASIIEHTNESDGDVTPVAITIGVIDASKRDPIVINPDAD